MTALTQYDRIEATGLWRESAEAQRREVIVSIGESTLTISDHNDRALAHWSLAALTRSNPGVRPALYHPDGDPHETLELAEDEVTMIEAIERLRTAIERGRPHPGRLRLVLLLGLSAILIALAVFWLPNAARDQALRVVPGVKRNEIGSALLARISRVSGLPCNDSEGLAALRKLGARLPSPSGAAKLTILRSGVAEATHLPGGTILLNRALAEDHETPEVLAGYIIAEHLAAQLSDPLKDFLSYAGLPTTLRLLTTSTVTEGALDSYAEHLLTKPAPAIDDETLLAGFKAWAVSARPCAYARDVTGEETLSLIEADPFAGGGAKPLLSDNDWLRLQAICGG